MISKFQILAVFFQLPGIIWTCGADVSGSSSKSAEFGISFFSPLSYTYPPDQAELFPGQSLTLAQANQQVKTDLDLAISKALAASQLYLSTPPTVNFTFTPQKLQIADGEVCVTDGTYIAIAGTIVYKCSTQVGSTTAPVSRSTQSSSSDTTTEPLVSTDSDGEPGMRALPRQRAADGVSAQPFVQSMTVIASANQLLFQSQWKQIGRSVQSALEGKKLLFNDDISVVQL